MKVLQINAVYGGGSTGRMTMELHEYMLRQGIDSYVACSKGTAPSDSRQIYIGNPMDVKLHSLMSRVTGLQGYFSKRATIKLLKRIDQLQPDIVHLGNLHSNYINVKMLLNYLGKHGIATVIVLHDCWFFTGKCSHYTIDQCDRWKDKCGNCPRLKKDIPSWMFDCTTKMLGDKAICFKNIKKLGVIGVSKWITSEAKKSILKDSDIILCIHNWIDTDIFKPDYIKASKIRKKFNLENKNVILGVSNIWSDAKGLQAFLKLAKLLDEREVILLVGNVSDVDLPENIINISPTNCVEELVGYYSAANVFLQLSPEETFGKVVAEALSCGTPVITVNSTANPELISGKNGYVCDVGDVIDIKKKIDLINMSPVDTYRTLCREYAKREFGMKDQMEKYIELYKVLLSR